MEVDRSPEVNGHRLNAKDGEKEEGKGKGENGQEEKTEKKNYRS
jgi:hypothetical protein